MGERPDQQDTSPFQQMAAGLYVELPVPTLTGQPARGPPTGKQQERREGLGWAVGFRGGQRPRQAGSRSPSPFPQILRTPEAAPVLKIRVSHLPVTVQFPI